MQIFMNLSPFTGTGLPDSAFDMYLKVQAFLVRRLLSSLSTIIGFISGTCLELIESRFHL